MTDSALPFPVRVAMTKEQLGESFQGLAFDHFDQQPYRFRMLVGTNWAPQAVPVSYPNKQNPICTMALLKHRKLPKAEVEVSAAFLERDVEPGDWYEYFMKQSGQEALMVRKILTPAGEAGDYLTNFPRKAPDILARTLVTKDGNRLWLVQGRCRREDYAELADELYTMISQRRLDHPSGDISAEPLATLRLAAPMKLTAKYPAGWKLTWGEPNRVGAKDLCLQLIEQNRSLAQINVSALPRDLESDAASLRSVFLESLRENGIEPGLESEEEVDDLPPGVEQAYFYQQEGTMQDQPLFLNHGVLLTAAGWVLIGVQAPGKEANHLVGMVARRAYRLLIQTLSFSHESKGNSGSAEKRPG
jgi:hypothetical protein